MIGFKIFSYFVPEPLLNFSSLVVTEINFKIRNFEIGNTRAKLERKFSISISIF